VAVRSSHFPASRVVVGRVGLRSGRLEAQPRAARRPQAEVKRLAARSVEGALLRYQVMANIVGTLIIPLFIFTGIKIFAGHCKLEVEIFGVAHGYLYIVYLITVGALAFRMRLNILWILAMCAAGLLPGMTFLVEWWVVTKKIHPLLATQPAVQGAPTR
jgi:integral membrane protein